MSAKPTWSVVKRRIDRGTRLTVVQAPGMWGAPTEGNFTVKRVVSNGMYLTQHHGVKDTQCFIRWAPARFVDVQSLDEWVVSTGGGLQAWAVLPDVPF